MPTRTRLNLTTSALAIAIGCGVPAAVQAHNDVGIAKGSGFDGPHEEILAGLLDGDIAKANLQNAARFGIAQVIGQRGLTATDRTVNGATCTGFEVGCIEGCVAHAAVDLAIYNGPFANARPIRSVAAGAELLIVGCDENWCEVLVGVLRGRGWVQRQFVRLPDYITDADIPPLPSLLRD